MSYTPSTSVAFRNMSADTFSAIRAAVPLVDWPGCSPPATTISPSSTACRTSCSVVGGCEYARFFSAYMRSLALSRDISMPSSSSVDSSAPKKRASDM